MNESNLPTSKGHALVMWIIWFSILQGAFIIQWVMGKGIPEGENVAEPMAAWLWVVCFMPLVVATMIRWYAIPKVTQPQQQLAAMITGLALSEAPIFLSLFLIGADYPQHQIAVLMVAVVSIIQFAPSYATPGYTIKPREEV